MSGDARRSEHIERGQIRLTRAEWDAIPPEGKLTDGDRCFTTEIGVAAYLGDPRAGVRTLLEVVFVDQSDTPIVYACPRCNTVARVAEDLEWALPTTCPVCGGGWTRRTTTDA